MSRELSAQRKREIQQLALQLQSQKTAEKFRLLRWVAVAAIVAVSLVVLYLNYIEKRNDSRRANIIGEINHQLMQAGSGDAVVQQNIAQQLPALEDYVAKQSALPEIQPSLAANLAGKSAKVFLRVGDFTHSVGKVDSLDQIASVAGEDLQNSGWLTVTLKRGVPLWINKSFVDSEDLTETPVSLTDDAKLRRTPVNEPENVLGRLEKGTILEVIGTRGDWLQVRTPEKFRFYIRTSGFQTLR